MRRSLRHLASVKPSASGGGRSVPRYLEPGWSTGLTGLPTHPTPRATLLYLYASTLERLAKSVPETSLYRQSVEALTKQRMAVVEAAVPPGHDAWLAKTAEQLAAVEGQDEFRLAPPPGASGYDDGLKAVRLSPGGRRFVLAAAPDSTDERKQEWDGETFLTAGDGDNPSAEQHQARLYAALKGAGFQEVDLTDDQVQRAEANGGVLPDDVKVDYKEETPHVAWDPEPQLTAQQ